MKSNTGTFAETELTILVASSVDPDNRPHWVNTIHDSTYKKLQAKNNEIHTYPPAPALVRDGARHNQSLYRKLYTRRLICRYRSIQGKVKVNNNGRP